jgi:hypothetical protein
MYSLYNPLFLFMYTYIEHSKILLPATGHTVLSTIIINHAFSIVSLSGLAALVATSPTFSFESYSGSSSPRSLPVHGSVNLAPMRRTAPSSADMGANGTGAVDWLYLGASEAIIGGSFLYRVTTAGSKSHSCSSGKDYIYA